MRLTPAVRFHWLVTGIPELDLLLLGAAAGALGTMLGVGGGVILVPGFSLLLGLPFREAVAASLICVVATSVAGSLVHLHRQRVRLHLAFEFQFYTVVGAVGAGLVAGFLPGAPLYFAFALMLLGTAWQMVPRHSTVPDEMVPEVRPGMVTGAAVGGGVIAGFLGVGGGIIFTPTIHLLLRQPFGNATATSIYMIGVTSAAAALVYLARGDVDPAIAATALLGTLAGAAAAAGYGERIRQTWLKTGFALLLLYTAFQMVRRGLAQL